MSSLRQIIEYTLLNVQVLPFHARLSYNLKKNNIELCNKISDAIGLQYHELNSRFNTAVQHEYLLARSSKASNTEI